MRLCFDVCQADPLLDWSHKYNKVADPLPMEKVALFGGQILQVTRKNSNRNFGGLRKTLFMISGGSLPLWAWL